MEIYMKAIRHGLKRSCSIDLGYCVTMYKNKEYFLLKEQNYAAVCDEHFTKEYEVYANEMELLENYKIDGTPLIELINELENVDSV